MAAVLSAGLAGCSDADPPRASGSRGDDGSPTATPSDTRTGTAGSSGPAGQGHSGTARPARPVTIAFAGDTHFAGSLAARLDDPATAMGPLAQVLDRADLAMVNLETAVTTRGTPETKQYVFRSPPVVFDALREAGVDVVTMANNHGLDYGPVSVPDALSAARRADMPVVGIGRDAEQAFKPWITTVHGQRIAFLGASAVVDAALVPTWSAGAAQPGIATALDGDNAALVAAIEQVRAHVDTVVVDMHYGADLTPCPTQIQRDVARDAVRAGADIVVGQHAHIVLGGGYRGSAYVDFGLGNFQFYSASGPTAETGVLTLTVDGRTVSDPTWTPGRIVGGLPTPLSGAVADQGRAHKRSLRGCTGLTASPR